MSSILEINNLSFSYGKQNVFNDINLSIQTGEVVCLMGPNGCGKTTLIDSIMAIHKPQHGGITLLNKPIEECNRQEIARKAAYVPQIHDITFPYTVGEMVLMGRTAYTSTFGKPSKEDEEICRLVLERVGISAFANKPYSRLSGGEIKLVLLARALGQKTPLILMDEPTAHLDFKNELLFLETIVSLCKEEEISVLMATHAPDHAFYYASKGLSVKAVMLSRGSLICQGTPDEVITSEVIREVYGVRAKILTDIDENGQIVKKVSLLESA